MIETFMVATNNSIGILLGEKNAPLPWRCHAPPDAPEVEEQRVTDAYQAGYEDGKNNNFDNVEKFKD